MQTYEYLQMNDKFFEETLVVDLNQNQNNKNESIFFEWDGEYIYKDDVPIKGRPEIKQFMEIKYIKRIELFYQAIVDEL